MNSAVSAQLQREVCTRVDAEYLETSAFSVVSLISNVSSRYPINGFRLAPVGEHSGWFIWRGVDLSLDSAVFEPRFVSQLASHDGEFLPFLGLGAGWRFLITPERIEVYFDEALLHLHEP